MADEDSNNHGRASVSVNGRSRGCSKAQLSLQKILQTISGNQIQYSATIDHHQRTHQSSASSNNSEMMGPTTAINPDQNNVRMIGSSLINFDLNLSPPLEEGEAVTDQSQTNQTNHPDSLEFPVVNAPGGGGAVQGNDENVPMGPEDQEEREERDKRMRRWRALLEVVENASGDDVRPEPMDQSELVLRGYGSNGRDMEGNASAAAEEEKAAEEVSAVAAVEGEAEPPAVVGRRKSGRVQVLPNKYRDSIVEPLTSLSSRHNRSSSKHVPTAKRRSTR